MKRIVILIAIFALAACVPIQPDDPQAPEPRAKGGLEELASVFAKMDQHDDSSEYLDLLLEFRGLHVVGVGRARGNWRRSFLTKSWWSWSCTPCQHL